MAKKKKTEENSEKSKVKILNRYLTTLVGLPLVFVIFIFSNNYVMDVALAILSALMMHEYLHCFKSTKKANPTSWLSYVCCALLAFTHLIGDDIRFQILVFMAPLIILILFLELILSNGKKNVVDVMTTVLGIIYIPLSIIFVSLLRGGTPMIFHRVYTGLIFAASWGSDGLAYIIGCRFGKHKLTPISPKKSVEGAIAGVVGSIAFSLVFILIINLIFNLQIIYWQILIISIVLAIIGQIGDIAASAIKRYCGIKDFSNLLPGHGGLLDRCDSLLFIAPFAYMLLLMI